MSPQPMSSASADAPARRRERSCLRFMGKFFLCPFARAEALLHNGVRRKNCAQKTPPAGVWAELVCCHLGRNCPTRQVYAPSSEGQMVRTLSV